MGSGLASLLILALGALLRISIPPPTTRTPDEQAYATFAAGFLQVGFARYPEVVRAFNSHPDLAELPSPARPGYLALLAGSMRVVGDLSPVTGSRLSQLASVIALILTGWLAVHFLPAGAAPIALLFYAVAPMDLAIARRAWQDDVVGLGALAMLAALLAHAERPRQATRVLFFVLGFASLLLKETGLLFLALGGAAMIWLDWRSRGPRGAWVSALGVAVTALAAGGLLAILCGGVGPLVRLLEVTARGRSTSDYVLRYQTGSPLYYVTGLAILDPLPWALAALTALAALAWPLLRLSPAARARIAGAKEHARGAQPASVLSPVSPLLILAASFVAYAVVFAIYPLRSLRFLTPLFAPVALLAALGARAAFTALSARLPRNAARAAITVVILALLLYAFADLRHFYDLFVRRGIPDLATPWFTQKP